MENSLEQTIFRDTGIPLIGQTAWGANICLFYETHRDLLESTAAFFAAGLKRHELCIWAVSDPVTPEDALAALRIGVSGFEGYAATNDIQITSGQTWNLKENEFNLQRIAGSWHEKLNEALERGYEGLRISGNASWLETNRWKEFREYELELDRCVAGKEIILLCTHSLGAKRALDIPDIVRAHHFTIYRRHHKWEFADTPDLLRGVEDWGRFERSRGGRFRGEDALTLREKAVLAQIIQGESSKEIGVKLGISPRTIEFHRANIMDKIGAKNVADLIRIVVEK